MERTAWSGPHGADRMEQTAWSGPHGATVARQAIHQVFIVAVWLSYFLFALPIQTSRLFSQYHEQKQKFLIISAILEKKYFRKY